MGKQCFLCSKDLGWKEKNVEGKRILLIAKSGAYHDEIFDKIKEKDVLCIPCASELDKRHAVEIWNYNKEVMTPEQFQNQLNLPENKDWVETAKQKLSLNEEANTVNNSYSNLGTILKQETHVDDKTDTVMSAAKLRGIIVNYASAYKEQWDKNGVVQFKNEHVAILQRFWGQQVQFIIAYDQITKEGYRLMAIDEGKSGGQASGGFTGGVNAYFYFQRMKYVR